MRKQKLFLFIGIAVLLCVDIGIKKTVIVFLGLTVAMVLVLLPLWLIAFIVGAVVTHNLKETWRDLSPLKIVKECFFSL